MNHRKKRRIEQTIARRARQLDALTPGWWKRVTRPIDLTSAHSCVLGQVYGDAFRSPFAVRLPFNGWSVILHRGFVYSTLGALAHATGSWHREVEARRSSHAPDVIPEWMLAFEPLRSGPSEAEVR